MNFLKKLNLVTAWEQKEFEKKKTERENKQLRQEKEGKK